LTFQLSILIYSIMSSPLRLLRKASTGARGIFVATRGTCQLVKCPAVVNGAVRRFSSQPEKAVCYEDLVKETLKKMISERGTENVTKVIADEDLERRFQHYDVSCRSTWRGSKF
jgi:hypothetical protein